MQLMTQPIQNPAPARKAESQAAADSKHCTVYIQYCCTTEEDNIPDCVAYKVHFVLYSTGGFLRILNLCQKYLRSLEGWY